MERIKAVVNETRLAFFSFYASKTWKSDPDSKSDSIKTIEKSLDSLPLVLALLDKSIKVN